MRVVLVAFLCFFISQSFSVVVIESLVEQYKQNGWQAFGSERECNVMDYGAKGDGKTDDTAAIRSTLISCSSNNVTYVIVFPMNMSFITGAVNISSNQIFLLESGSSILAVQNNDSYHYPYVEQLPSYPISTGKNSAPRFQGFLSSYRANNFAIIGTGTIDGQGEYWWDLYNNGDLTMTRPRLFELCYSTNIFIAAVTLRRSAFWCLHLYSSENITIRQITIDNPTGSPNTDGIDIDSSKNCLVDGVHIKVGDDHISIKSGQNSQGYEYNTPSENILIQNSIFGIGGGLAIGSETSGGIHNVTFLNNTMTLSGNGPRMKTCPHYGNPISNIEWNGLHLEGTDQAVFLNTNYECNSVNSTIPNGGYHDIRILNISGFGLQAGTLMCYPGGCTDFLFSNVDITSILGFRCQNITGVAINTHPGMCFDN